MDAAGAMKDAADLPLRARRSVLVDGFPIKG